MKRALALLLLPSLALADPLVDRCVEAHHDAQTERRAGHLAAARAALATCAQAGCPQLISADCQRWRGEVDAQIPSVVISARDASGAAIAGVRLFLDGVPVAAERAIELDPGAHQIRAEAEGKQPAARALAVVEGVRGQRVELTLDAWPRPAPRPIARATYVLGGVALAGLATAGGFGAAGLIERGRLDDRHCAPDCPPGDVDTVRRNFAISDVALGVGVLAAAAAVIYYLVGQPAPRAGELVTVRF